MQECAPLDSHFQCAAQYLIGWLFFFFEAIHQAASRQLTEGHELRIAALAVKLRYDVQSCLQLSQVGNLGQ